LPLGVDPVAFKAIYESFSEKEKDHFKALMLESLMPDDNHGLIDAKKNSCPIRSLLNVFISFKLFK